MTDATDTRQVIASARERLEASGLPSDWLEIPVHWGVKAKEQADPATGGLRFSLLNVDVYGEVPERWENNTEIPRGAIPDTRTEQMGYSIFDKSEVWSDLCADLYEDAIQDRWNSSTEIPWESLKPLDGDVERAICQIATLLSEYGWAKAQTAGRWLQEISYGFIEVKLFLGTVVFDAARLYEVWRKRALANGGGLGRGGRNWKMLPIVQSYTFSEFVVASLMHDTMLLALLREGEGLSQNEAEREIFRRCAQDTERHLRYWVDHMRYLMLKEPVRREEIHRYLNKAEWYLAHDEDDTLYSALAVIMAEGREQAEEAMVDVAALRKAQVELYLEHLEQCHLGDRRDRLSEPLRRWAAIPIPVPEEKIPV